MTQLTFSVKWVVGCECAFTLQLRNRLPFQFNIHNLRLETEGCGFECEPVSVSLPIAPHAPQSHNITGRAKQAGELAITGQFSLD